MHLRREEKVSPQVRNVLEKDNLIAERDVQEQREVLMDLPHIAHVRHDGQAESFFASSPTVRNSLTPPSRVQSACT